MAKGEMTKNRAMTLLPRAVPDHAETGKSGAALYPLMTAFAGLEEQTCLLKSMSRAAVLHTSARSSALGSGAGRVRKRESIRSDSPLTRSDIASTIHGG